MKIIGDIVWKDILKNQISVPGLSMRGMDLDNIIEEENDDDCFNDVENFFNNASKRMLLLTPSQVKWKFRLMMTNEEACALYEALTTIPFDKFTHAFEAAWLAESQDNIYFGQFGSFKVSVGAWWNQMPELYFNAYDEKTDTMKSLRYIAQGEEKDFRELSVTHYSDEEKWGEVFDRLIMKEFYEPWRNLK